MADQSLIGATLAGKYKLVRLLGEGGMGAVYEAKREGTSESAAVKVIQGRLLAPKSDGVQRFRREARAAAAVDSEHIVQILDSGTDEATGLLYIAMERLRGEDLQQVIDRLGPLAPEAALRIAAQALIGLQKAHEAKIIHRDIKPANLFLHHRDDGTITVKLLDFGIAKIKADPLGAPQTTGLTNTGSLLGSPLYMSPEQVQSSRDVDHRTDLWSLASALYCALAGRAPYDHVASLGQLIYRIITSPPRSLGIVAPWISSEIAEAVHGALKLKAKERYASAALMLEALRLLLPEGLTLRGEMLVAIPPELRVTAPKFSSSPPSGEQRRAWDPNVETWPLEPDEMLNVGPTKVPANEAKLLIGAGISPDATTASAGEVAPAASTMMSSTEKPRPKSETTPPGSARRARPPRGKPAPGPILLGFGVLGVLGWLVWSRAHPEPPPSLAATASPGAPRAPAEPPPSASTSVIVGSNPPVSPESARHVNLVIVPKEASVTIDEENVSLHDGIAEIVGTLGSEHKVRVTRSGMKEKLEMVTVTEGGASPAKIELTPLAAGARPPRPGSGSAAQPASPPVKGTTAAPPPKPPPSDDDLAQ